MPSQLHLHAIRDGLLNLGLLLHHSTGSISSDNKPTTPTVHIQPYRALQMTHYCAQLRPVEWDGVRVG